MKRRAQHAFTLIEMLVALAILAIALSASMRTLHLATDSAQSTKERLLATWAAQNRLAEIEARRAFPPTGETSGEVEMAGLRLAWRQSVTATPNPVFRKVEVRVGLPATPDYALAKLTGYATEAAP